MNVNPSDPRARRRVLIVDDEENVRLTLTEALRGMGLDAEAVARGDEALERLATSSYWLVFLDLRMPGMSGEEVLRQAVALRPDVRIVVFTAHGTVQDAVTATKLGAIDFVEKPVSLSELRALVERIDQGGGRTDEEEAAPAADPSTRYRIVIPLADPSIEDDLMKIALALVRGREEAELAVVDVMELPLQTPLSYAQEIDPGRAERQQALLQDARRRADEVGVHLEVQHLVAHSSQQAVLDAVEEERTDLLLLGWRGESGEDALLPPSMLHRIAQAAACGVTLVRVGTREPRDVVAVVDSSPHAVRAVRQALALTQSAGVATLTLLHVRSPEDSEEDARAVIRRIAEEAGVPEGKYVPELEVADDSRRATVEAVRPHDAICFGAPHSTPAAQALFGSTPEAVAEGVPASTVLVVRGPQQKRRTVVDSIRERL